MINCVRTALLISTFGLVLLLAALGQWQTQAWASSASGALRDSLPGTLPTDTPTPTLTPTVTPTPTPSPTPDPRRPEIYIQDAPLAMYNELAIGRGITLSYRSKGVAPLDNNLLIQSKNISEVVTPINPAQWVQVAEKTFEIGPSALPYVVEVGWITSTLPISWRGVAGVWLVNATNTGATLMTLPKQVITTSLSISRIFTDRVAATTAFTFTLRATPGVSADWGDVYPTEFRVLNSCPGSSWAQRLSTRDRFSFTVPTSYITSYTDVRWEIRHQEEPRLLLANGLIYGPVCVQRIYLPVVQR